MKATKAGTIIARALSKYEGTEVGTVTAFIDNSYSNGSKLENILNPGEVTAEDGSVTLDHPTLNSQALLAQFMAQKAVQKEGATLSDVYVDRVAPGANVTRGVRKYNQLGKPCVSVGGKNTCCP
jgi:hypothetical protein